MASEEAGEVLEDPSFDLDLPPSSVFVPRQSKRIRTRARFTRRSGKSESMENAILAVVVALVVILGGYVLFKELTRPRAKASQAEAASVADAGDK